MRYTRDRNTYFAITKTDRRDTTEVEVGDSKQPDFKPQVKVMRWSNDANVSFRLISPNLPAPKPIVDGKAILVSGDKHVVSIYDNPPLPEYFHEPTHEFEVTLLEKPVSNQLVFSVVSKNLDFHYQPPLSSISPDRDWEYATETDAYNKDGKVISHRPENLVGGYAMFHKRPVNIEGGQLYRWGLFGWIYRPKIVDSAGNWTWGKLEMSGDASTLTVTIPQEFLDDAVYPIHHAAGLTFGDTGTGGTTTVMDPGNGPIFMRFSTDSGAGGGSATSISWYLTSTAGSNLKFALYGDASNLPTPLRANGSGSMAATTTTVTISFGTPYTLSASTLYYLMGYGETATVNCYYASGSSIFGGKDTTNVTYASVPYATPTLNSTYTNRLYHTYCTYTAGGGATPIPVFMNQYRQRVNG